MRKVFGGALVAMLLICVGTGNAITFTDVYTPEDGPVFLKASSPHNTFDFYHDITPEFQPDSDKITSANIELNFTDDEFWAIDCILIWCHHEEKVNFTFGTVDYGTKEIASLFYLTDTISFSISTQLLQNDGKLYVELKIDKGDVYFNQSTLTATADAVPTATPEPGSLLLLGSGLSGLGFIGRKRLRAAQGQAK